MKLLIFFLAPLFCACNPIDTSSRGFQSRNFAAASENRNVGNDGIVRGSCSYLSDKGREIRINYEEENGHPTSIDVNPHDPGSNPLYHLITCRAMAAQLTQNIHQDQTRIQGQIAQTQKDIQQQIFQNSFNQPDFQFGFPQTPFNMDEEIFRQNQLLQDQIRQHQNQVQRQHEQFFNNFPFNGGRNNFNPFL